jgi:anti-sigma factor RsiW
MTDHQIIIELIPWYLNGTLEEAEDRLVRDHLGGCLACRQAAKQERQLQTLVSTEPAIPFRREASLSALLNRIDDSATQGKPGRRQQFARQRVYWRIAGAAACLAAMAATALLLTDGNGADEPFSTVATPEVDPAARVDLIFAADLSAGEIRAIVESYDADLVAGPSAIGRYTIALRPADDIEEKLAALREDPRIELASRSFIEDADR